MTGLQHFNKEQKSNPQSHHFGVGIISGSIWGSFQGRGSFRGRDHFGGCTVHIDGHENENAKKKTKHDVALFHEFLVLKGETRQMGELTPQELNREYERGIRA